MPDTIPPARRPSRFFAWLSDPLHLKVYGDSLCTSRARKELGFGTILLLAVACFDTFVWSHVWGMVLHTDNAEGWFGRSLNVLLAIFVIAIPFLLIERNLLCLDVYGLKREMQENKRFSIVMLPRIAFLVVAAIIVAQPLELKFFEAEIEEQLIDQEKAARDEIRARAEQSIRDDSVKKQDAVRTRRSTDIGNTDVSTATRRTQIMGERGPARDKLASEVSRYDGACTTSISSSDPTTQSYAATYCAQAKQKRADLVTYEKETARLLEALDKERSTTQQNDKADREKQLRELEADETAALQELGTIDPDTLAARYGGTWRMPRGYSQRNRALETVVEKDPQLGKYVWYCRGVAFFIGMLPLLYKLILSIDLAFYFSLRMQAERGHPEARELLQTRRRVNAGGADVLVQRFHAAASAFLVAYGHFFVFASAVASKKSSHNLYKEQSIVTQEVRMAWKKHCKDAAATLLNVRKELEDMNIPEPEWMPDHMAEADLVRWEEPTNEDLYSLGWNQDWRHSQTASA